MAVEKFDASRTLVMESLDTPESTTSMNFLFRKPAEPSLSVRTRNALLSHGISMKTISTAGPEALCKMYYWGPNRPISMDTSLETKARIF